MDPSRFVKELESEGLQWNYSPIHERYYVFQQPLECVFDADKHLVTMSTTYASVPQSEVSKLKIADVSDLIMEIKLTLLFE